MRFNIRTMMIAIAAIAVVLVSLRFVLLFVILFLGLLVLSCGAVARGLWLAARPFRRVAALGFGVAAILTNATCLAASVAVPTLGGTMIILAVCVLGIPVVFGFGAASSTVATSENTAPRRSRILAWGLTVSLSIAPLSMLFTSWPFRLAFAVSRPALDGLADQVAGGAPVIVPKWAGAFRIVGSAVDPATGTVLLITDPNPGGRVGFARLHALTAGSSPFYNLAYDRRLTEKWTYVEED
jgi:hypothetical protein